MFGRIRIAHIAGALLFLGLAACTDPTVEPSSTSTEVNTFNDPASYRRFLAKVYAGLAVTGQQGAAGDRDVFSITDEGFSQYWRLYWELQELPTDEAVIAWGDQGLPELNTQVGPMRSTQDPPRLKGASWMWPVKTMSGR